ncbi:YeeE/YedE family protein [Chitinophaga polysaccharea]|uniref:YeeE/YedE family protein n=1 Tax=Chitinophaga TaxID=79328 RepID=UPI0014557BE3|nr:MULTISPECIES: YeeE/YedE thiosulfate transporter family protein [Chitinophaga]NLR57951.1 YeeE/YedE family protein [Chitinophaga polysaccharea]NLU93544.1 YeeE/YedE family protein [Chitinophaga sp. Ak27]
MQLLKFIQQPWHWSVSGLLIGLTVPVLLILGNKVFGISSSLRHICAACFPANITFFKYDWKKESWNLFFAAGILVGAFIAGHYLQDGQNIQVAAATKERLASYGIHDYRALLPSEIFSWQQLFTWKGLIFFVIGGFMIGFGTRYAGGCTSGHSIMGLSNLQWPSLVATVCFMAGGFASANLFIPLIFKWLH